MRKLLFVITLLAVLLAPAAALGAAGGGADPAVARQLAAVRRATAKYHDVSRAIADGYLAGDHCSASPAGGMGFHYINPDRMGRLDPARPDILLYAPSADGPKLVGVEYFAPAVLQKPDGSTTLWFDPHESPPASWRFLPGPSLFGQAFDGPMAGHGAGMPWHHDLHVWLWHANPEGVFADWNPNVGC